MYGNFQTVYLGVGSNIGDRAGSINKALAILEDSPGVQLERVSPVIETRAIGGPAMQARYLNAAVRVQYSSTPVKLLELLMTIEKRLGRIRTSEKWAPRTIDLDILLFNNEIIELDEPPLAIPHPLMQSRLFVLGPLSLIAPNVVHPKLNKTISELLADLQKELGVTGFDLPLMNDGE